MSRSARIKRAVFEWATIAAATAAAGSSVLWLVSACSTRADFSLIFNPDRGLSVADGAISISNQLNSMLTQDQTERIYGDRGVRAGWKMLGCRYCYFTYNSRAHWMVSVSLVYPALIFALMALLFLRQHRRVGRQLAETSRPIAPKAPR